MENELMQSRCRLDVQLKERAQTVEENHALFGKMQIFEEARQKTEEQCAGQVCALFT